MTLSSLRKHFGLAVLAVAFTFTTSMTLHAQDVSGKIHSAPKPPTQLDGNKLIPYKNSVPAQVASSLDEGRAGDEIIEGQIGLTRTGDGQAALAMFEKKVRDPQDAMYQKWLTPQELGENFPPDQKQVESFTSWLESFGLTVTNVDAPRLLLTFSGPASSVEKAFVTEIHNYQTEDGSIHYSNSTNPRIPGSVYGQILKLNNFAGASRNYVSVSVGSDKNVAPAQLAPVKDSAEKTPELGTGTEPFRSYGFTITPGFQEPGVSTPQTLTVRVETKDGEPVPTGHVVITGDSTLGTLGVIDSKDCKATAKSAYTCAVIWNPPADMPTGDHQIAAMYTGDQKFAPTYTTSRIHSNGTTATSTSVTVTPINTDSEVNLTFTTVTTLSSSTAPLSTGTIALSCADPSLYWGFGTGTNSCSNLSNLPAAKAVSACTYSSPTITCTFTYDLDANDATYGSYGFVATYSGDTTYATSNGQVFADDYEVAGLGGITVTPSPLSTAPGSGATITYTAVYTATTYTNNPTLLTYPTTAGGGPSYIELTGSTLTGGETIIAGTASACSWNTATLQLTCTLTSAVPTTLGVGTYPVNAQFSGTYFDESVVGSGSFQVTSATGVNTVGVSLNPNSVVYASGTNVAVSVTNTWTGSTAPTGTITLADAQGTLPTQVINLSTCTLGTNTYTCNYTWTSASTATASPDAVTATYSGDSNFKPSTGSANETITGIGTGTVALGKLTSSTSPTTQVYGTATTLSLAAALTGVTGDGFPTGTFSWALGTATAQGNNLGNATLPSTPCVESGTDKITCTAVAGATLGTQPVGSYYLWNNYSGNTTYARATYLSTSAVYTVTKQTPTLVMASPLTASPVVQSAGSLSAFTVTSTLTWTGTGLAPTAADVVFSSTAGGTFGATTCGSVTPATCSATFTPTGTDGAGNYNINVKFSGDANYNATTVTAITSNYQIKTAPTVSLSAVSSPYGSTAGVSITATSNAAGSVVTFGTAGGVGGSFSPTTCTISGTTCSVNYIPSGTLAVGTYPGDLTASFTAAGTFGPGSATSTLTITAVTPDIEFSSVTHNMGSVIIGNSTRYTVAVTNTTGTAIPFTAIQLVTSASPNPFATQNNCGTSIPTGGCEIAFEYSPVAGNSGTQTATWSFTGTPGGTTFSPSNGGTLTGTVAPSGNVTITTAGHNFGDVTVGTTSPTYGTVITNSTNESVTLTLGSVSSPFASVTNCPTTLGAGVSCNLQFTFSPTTTGLVQQMYSISVNGGAIPLLVDGNPTSGVTLTGTGD